jgi:periplasmic divalent cation tolerance protein
MDSMVIFSIISLKLNDAVFQAFPSMWRMQQICLIKTSVASQQDARNLAGDMMAARMAACIQITGPGESLYRWQGKLEQAEEWYLSIKTSERKRPAVVDWLMQKHPYDVPEIICTEGQTTVPYDDWLNDAVT